MTNDSHPVDEDRMDRPKQRHRRRLQYCLFGVAICALTLVQFSLLRHSVSTLHSSYTLQDEQNRGLYQHRQYQREHQQEQQQHNIEALESVMLEPPKSLLNSSSRHKAKVAVFAKTLRISDTQPSSDLYFIHQRKTGTSLITLLRNRNDACDYKDFTCFCEQGGGFGKEMAMSGQESYPYLPSMILPNHKRASKIGCPRAAQLRVNTCHGHLPNCARRNYHCPYERCGSRPNKVTMLRNPFKWFKSHLMFSWLYDTTVRNVSLVPLLPFTSQISFVANTSNVTTAFDILQNDYVWWGVTDFWKISVCLFHCELGGVTRESELLNSRDLLKAKTPDDVHTHHPRPEVLVPNTTAYVLEHYSEDLELYQLMLGVFWRRTDACNCATTES